MRLFQSGDLDIISLFDSGILSGYPDGSFHPDAPMTKAEFIKLFVTAIPTELPTVDRILWMCRKVIGRTMPYLINGYEDGSFHPWRSVTREKAATIIARAKTDAFEQGATTAANFI